MARTSEEKSKILMNVERKFGVLLKKSAYPGKDVYPPITAQVMKNNEGIFVKITAH